MKHVQGPNGPYGLNNVQKAETINNTYFLGRVPEDHYTDRLTLSSNQAVYTQAEVAQIMMQSYVCGARDALTGYNQNYLTQDEQLQCLFNDCERIVDSLYSQSSNDPLGDVRGLGAMTAQAIREAKSTMNGNFATSDSTTNNTASNSSSSSLQNQLAYLQELQNMNALLEQKIAQLQEEIQGQVNSGDPSFTGNSENSYPVSKNYEVNEEKIQMAARSLHAAMDGAFHTDEKAINETLSSLNPTERAAVEVIYGQMYGDGDPEALRSDLRSELSFGEEDEAIGYLDAAAHFNPISAAAALHEAMDGLGTDDDTVKAIFQNATPEQLKHIEAVYDELYGGEGALKNDIKGDYSQLWDGAAAGAAKGAAAFGTGAAIVNAVPGLGQIAYGAAIGVGSILGGIWGMFSDPSGNERNEYVNKLNVAKYS